MYQWGCWLHNTRVIPVWVSLTHDAAILGSRWSPRSLVLISFVSWPVLTARCFQLLALEDSDCAELEMLHWLRPENNIWSWHRNNFVLINTFKCCESCLRRFVVGWFLDVIQGWVRICPVVSLRLGFTSNILDTMSLARLETVAQLPEFMSYWPLPILWRMSSGESSGPDANGVSPASIVKSSTPRLHTSHAAS